MMGKCDSKQQAWWPRQEAESSLSLFFVSVDVCFVCFVVFEIESSLNGLERTNLAGIELTEVYPAT